MPPPTTFNMFANQSAQFQTEFVIYYDFENVLMKIRKKGCEVKTTKTAQTRGN